MDHPEGIPGKPCTLDHLARIPRLVEVAGKPCLKANLTRMLGEPLPMDHLAGTVLVELSM